MRSLDDEAEELMSASKAKKQPDKPPPIEKANHQKHESNAGTFVCIGVRRGCITTQGGKAPVIVMELEADDGESVVKFFNARVTKVKNLAVPRNSDFARLYRLATGENPVARFSRINTLLKHFIGIEFQCMTTRDTDKKGSEFCKVTRITPSVPHVSDAWTATGAELKRPPKQKQESPQNAVEKQQNFGNDLSIFCQFSDNAKSPQAMPDMGYSQFESHLTRKVVTYNIPPVPSPNPPLKTEPQRRVWEKRPDETEDDFLDRFLTDTISRPPHQPFASNQTLH